MILMRTSRRIPSLITALFLLPRCLKPLRCQILQPQACWIDRQSRSLTFHRFGGCQVRGSFETDLAEVCAPRQMNVGLLAYSPLAGGSLSGKYIKGNDPKARFNLFPGGCCALGLAYPALQFIHCSMLTSLEGLLYGGNSQFGCRAFLNRPQSMGRAL